MVSLTIHGSLLAAAGWFWDTATPPRTPTMIAIAMVPETALNPAPGTVKARPVTKITVLPKAQRQSTKAAFVLPPLPPPSPSLPKASKVTLAKTKFPHLVGPMPDWAKRPPVPPKRPDFSARPAPQPRITVKINPAASTKPLPLKENTVGKTTQPAPRQSAGLSLAGSGGKASPPTPLSGRGNQAPRYPWISRQRGEQGRVIVAVAVSPKGEPDKVRIKRSSGHRRLDEAAIAAVREWRFAPARRAGRTVGGHTDVPITFRLSD
jgi:protein TonB